MKILIVGQGIAGTLLAWSLRRRGAKVHIADVALPGHSSRAAAGIINPVTGKRFVKSWRFDEFFPVAKNIYQQLEQELGITFWEERPTLRLLGTPEELGRIGDSNAAVFDLRYTPEKVVGELLARLSEPPIR